MSASPMARHISDTKIIPSRRIMISDPSEMPRDYSSTPGGTLFSTTPGGTKIVYERAFLMNLRNSPISKTPPKWDIPDEILRGSPVSKGAPKRAANNLRPPKRGQNGFEDHEQFHMEM